MQTAQLEDASYRARHGSYCRLHHWEGEEVMLTTPEELGVPMLK